MSCIACARYLHDECILDPCCCTGKAAQQVELEDNPYERAKVIRDPLSTGRKRAAVAYPIGEGEPCDWNRLKNCGGGLNPIIGCLDGKAKHLHHGPDKDTLNNSENNVHKLCTHCHVRWHNGNDWCHHSSIPHSPVSATVEEILQNEVDWTAGKYAEWTRKRQEFFKDKKELEVKED